MISYMEANCQITEVINRMVADTPVAFTAHENPELAHHNGHHADRVSYALHGLVLNATTQDQQQVLERCPSISGAIMMFPRGHDLLYQVLTGQRNIDLEQSDPGKKLNSKTAHDIAAGLIMRAQTAEIETVLTDAFDCDPGVSKDILHEEAVVTGILAQIISSPHGKPRTYEKILHARTKAYTRNVDSVTGESIIVPRAYKTEKDAASLAKAYRNGDIDPFSLNQAQMNAIATYELSHPNPHNLVIDADMSTYEYGAYPGGLHPAMLKRYGETLQVMAKDSRPFEQILPKEIIEQRGLVEYMGKLALLADTYDLVAEPTGRVIRSLLTQKTFAHGRPRPVFPKGMTEDDGQEMLYYVEKSDGDDTQEGANASKGYSLLRRLDWEVRNWFPFKSTMHPEIQKLIGETSIMAQLEHFRIIRTWMDTDPKKWTAPVQAFYDKRLDQYEKKRAKRGNVAFDSSWLRDEKDDVFELLNTLPHAGQYTEQDFAMFDLYAEQSIRYLQKQHDISDERLAKLSTQGENFSSPYTKQPYDVVPVHSLPLPNRGLEPASR